MPLLSRRARTTRSLYAFATFASLSAALTVSVLWAVSTSPKMPWEPVIQSLALVAAISGVFAERRAAAREREHQLLTALRDENLVNQTYWESDFLPQQEMRHRVYPRLNHTATDAALASGLLSGARYSALHPALLHWRASAGEMNRRFDLAEIRSFVRETPEAELEAWHQALHASGGRLHQTKESLDEVRSLVEELLT
ncbi:hypothetical protein [Streptomyces sp. NPDC050738]|uniref:hypothetical protein n=1 Tax=Streptomyces sp. NPDC050738 TaxID=3154744 RepID=UPI0034304298